MAATGMRFRSMFFSNAEVMHHFLPQPLRVSAMRTLGAYMNTFAIESMDELAIAAKDDPVAFQPKHLDDARAKDVVVLAAERFGWEKRPVLEKRAVALVLPLRGIRILRLIVRLPWRSMLMRKPERQARRSCR
jgi:hypothetical protein